MICTVSIFPAIDHPETIKELHGSATTMCFDHFPSVVSAGLAFINIYKATNSGYVNTDEYMKGFKNLYGQCFTAKYRDLLIGDVLSERIYKQISVTLKDHKGYTHVISFGVQPHVFDS